ncbi:MAG: CBS domain-containing protein [Methanomicrobiaceae archaeon]|nr:CBS domain-containing protein [Methanomicrobiaceae archaeon]
MKDSIQIGQLFGIPIRLHFTFLIVIPLFTMIIAFQIAYSVSFLEMVFRLPGSVDTSIITSGHTPYILGMVVTLSLFAGVLIHELAHSVVAISKGLEVKSITLLILGGVSAIDEGKSPDPNVEMPMAIAGPLASLVIGIITGVIALFSFYFIPQPAIAGLLFYIFGYLSFLNILLFLFNLIPAFPMDGGRVLRAFLAKRMPIHQATAIAADIGRGFAIVFGIIGLLWFNPILIIIAVFVYLGAGQEATMVKYSHLLEGVSVADAMSSPVTYIAPGSSVDSVVQAMYNTKHLGFPVIENGTLIGVVTLHDINHISSIDREAMIVKDVMTRDPATLPPEAPLTDALKLMSTMNIGRVPVVKEGQVEGIVTRTDILRFLELKEIQ